MPEHVWLLLLQLILSLCAKPSGDQGPLVFERTRQKH